MSYFNVEGVLRDITREVAKTGLNLEELTRKVEGEANRIAREEIPSQR